MRKADIIQKLKSLANVGNAEGMERFGMARNGRLGISMPALRLLAREIGKNHDLALDLWSSPYKEAKILAGLIEEAGQTTQKQADEWVKDFDSWDVCDQVCFVFDRTPFASQKAKQWAKRREELIKRAGFSMMAGLAVHSKTLKDKDFVSFFPLIKSASADERNFVKKAVNWALRQIGKRNLALNALAIKTALEIKEKGEKLNSKSAKWIANDALRELRGEAVRKMLKSKQTKAK
ncbi:MAG: DNA alkylation repair protein [Candidatus Pacebacteria bacterium]|nr:DNA alkylation repair protein [Candidatus Paceibacterota bacterium]